MKLSTSLAVGLAALLVGGAALAVGIVAVTRDNGRDSNPTATAMVSMSSMSAHMAAAPRAGVEDATAARGGQPLAHTVDGDTWVFKLTAKPVEWQILPGTRVTAWSYNGTVPGPEIRVPYGQKVRVVVKNELPEPTTVHWHGIAVPNAMDGVPGVTQQPIGVGKSFTYSFSAIPAGGGQGGTFMYHSHYDEDRQVGLGLSAPLVIVPPKQQTASYAVDRTLMLAEWNLDPQTGATRPPMEMEGVLPNYFTINGKSYPATQPIDVKPGQRVLLRLIGAGQFVHPMHLHGTAFTVVAKDGHALPTPYKADVIDVGPGERYDIAFTLPNGKWVLHCHIGHHLTNNGEGPGGLLMVVNASGERSAAAPAAQAGTGNGGASDHTGSMDGMDGMSGMSGMSTTP